MASVIKMMEGMGKVVPKPSMNNVNPINFASKLESKTLSSTTHATQDLMGFSIEHTAADFDGGINNLLDAYSFTDSVVDVLPKNSVLNATNLTRLVEGSISSLDSNLFKQEPLLSIESLPASSVSLDNIELLIPSPTVVENQSNPLLSVEGALETPQSELEIFKEGEITLDKVKEMVEESVLIPEELSIQLVPSTSSMEEVLNDLPTMMKEIKEEIEEQKDLEKFLEETKEDFIEKMPSISEALQEALHSTENSSAPSLSEILDSSLLLEPKVESESPAQIIVN
eukprot:TRINITY_DN6335_c0_g1_i1.p1 TRINITY_DN6335_c0_g1~~TRINITY_DN6335_c0_g1_i1.p1  ORF type:complete len:284 (-),score=113.29 TRINITY_DN6335_c0_g1_i1:51-902(-)